MTAARSAAPRASRVGLLHEIARGLVTGLLITMLVLTGQLVASAKGDAPRDMAGALCLSGSVVTFAIGEDGSPEGPAHICPDALLIAIDGGAVGAPAAPRTLIPGLASVISGAQRPSFSLPESPPPARAPPFPV